MIPTAWIIHVNWLAIFTGIVHLAVAVDFLWIRTEQWPFLKTSDGPIVTAHSRIAYEELMVSLMVHIHADLYLYRASRYKSSMRLLYRLDIIH